MYLSKQHFIDVLDSAGFDQSNLKEFDYAERLSPGAYLFSSGSHLAVIYQSTVVFYGEIINVDGKQKKVIKLNSGGWFTVTTKKWQNYALDLFNTGWHIYQKNFSWYITDGDKFNREYTENVLTLTV